MDYFIGDTHFGGESIIAFANRPFPGANEMDKYTIRRWNSVVTNEDRVFLVGDFFDNTEESFVKNILSKLNGEIILIKGNHDEGHLSLYKSLGITVYEFPIIYNEWYFISHEPMYMTEKMPYLNIFAHVHNNPIYKDFCSNAFCVSADRLNYTPISLKEIMEKVKKEG